MIRPARPKRVAVLQDECREDLRYWVDTNRKTALRLLDLMEAVMRDPFGGIGKPEPLKHDFAGYWSRRITDEHRLVYKVTDTEVRIAACRYHYGR